MGIGPSRGTWLGIGVTTMFAVFALLVAVDRLDTPDGRPPAGGEATVTAFLDAWERSRRGTYAVDAEFVRRARDGNELRSASRLVRRPPDSLVVGFDNVELVRDDEITRCLADPTSDAFRCTTASTDRSFADRVADDIALMRQYVTGPAPLYAVGRDGDRCFDLQRTRAQPLSPYGAVARFCFDGPTGAPAEITVQHDGVTDRTIALSIRATVTEADLRVPG